MFMVPNRVSLSLIMIFFWTISTCIAADSWKVVNRGAAAYIVRLRPSSNRKAGFIPQKVEPGETKTIALTHQGSFDLNIQFLDKDGKVKVSWTADQPIDLRNRTYPEIGDNLTDVAMQDPPIMGPDGKQISVTKRMPMLKGIRFEDTVGKLHQLGAVSTEDPKNPKMDFEGAVNVGDSVIKVQLSGPPKEPSIALDGVTYQVADLGVCLGPRASVVLSGTYSSDDHVGAFLLERRDGFPFHRISLDLKVNESEDWTSFNIRPALAAGKNTGGDGARIDEVRDIAFEFQRPLKEGQALIEKRLTAIEDKFHGRLAELELRLANPKLFGAIKGCVECHQSTPGTKAPQNMASLLRSIPKMSVDNREEMIRRSKLDEQVKEQFLNYAAELAITFGP